MAGDDMVCIINVFNINELFTKNGKYGKFCYINYHNKMKRKKYREINTILTLTKRKSRVSALILY